MKNDGENENKKRKMNTPTKWGELDKLVWSLPQKEDLCSNLLGTVWDSGNESL
jgi:hypothetical protein